MLIITAFHFAYHGKFNFPFDTITINRLWQQFLCMGGGLGNCIFVLISGYFLIKSPGIKALKVINLWLRILFYSLVIYLLFAILRLDTFSLDTLLRVAQPITKMQYGFATKYFMMYLLHGLLNKFLINLTRENYKKFLIVIFVLWPTIYICVKSFFDTISIVNFILLYILAGYVRLHLDNLGAGKGKKFICMGLFFITLNYLTMIIMDILSLKYVFFHDKITFLAGMFRPFTILACLCLLIGFKNLNMSYSKIINLLGAATFGVYLIHDNNFVRPFLWVKVFHNATYQDSPYLIPYSILVTLLVYIACTVIEIIRSKIFKTLSRGYLS